MKPLAVPDPLVTIQLNNIDSNKRSEEKSTKKGSNTDKNTNVYNTAYGLRCAMDPGTLLPVFSHTLNTEDVFGPTCALDCGTGGGGIDDSDIESLHTDNVLGNLTSSMTSIYLSC